ncbi:glycosyltransferase family 39 protein [Patescibacteria group bacterium]|nr:glycosyltransferase family 39 protein [Patescibacteria group bacterium]
MWIKERKTIIILLGILVIAGFFRLWQLDSIPPGLYPDEAINGNEALDILQQGKFKIFYPENNGREGLFIWLISLSFLIFGPSIWAIKIVPATFGILTVLGIYLLAKEMFSRNIALLSSFFSAISFWHINFSRIGFRAILVPFVLVFGFYFLFRGFRQKKILFFVISGIFFGLGFYTYISYRFVVLLLALILIFRWLPEKSKVKSRKPFLLSAFYFLLSIFVVALPIGIYFLLNPGDFFGRAAGVSILTAERPFYELGKSIILHLQMFIFYGDVNWRHNFAGSPQLLWPIGIFFLIGLIYSLYSWIKDSKFFPFCFLISWGAIMLLPGFLSSESIPHALRVIGVIPVAYIFAALGALWLFKKTKKFFKTKNQLIALYLCIFILFLSIAYAQFDKYFCQWAEKTEVEAAFSKNYVEIGNYLNSLPDDVQKYVIVNQSGVPVPYPDGIPMPSQTSMFIERTKFGKIRATYILPEEINKIKIDEKTVIIPLHNVQP